MFLGHFGVALAAKRAAPGVSLGTTILAAEFLDVLWPLLLLAGVEHVAIVPGITRVTPLDFTDYPWSHSLVMTIVWAALFGAAYFAVRRKAAYALWLAALVASHWVLDWISHRPDLPLVPGGTSLHGLGLWNSLAATFTVEAALFAGGIALYLAGTRPIDRTGRIAFWALVAVLAASYLGATLGPPPPSVDALAYTGLIGYAMVAWGWWVDRHRRPAGAAS